MELYPIAYRDISALVDVGGLSPDAIHDWFVRYRKSKGKTMDVQPQALRASWNPFVRLWNEERIREKVERWEAAQRRYSLSALREEVHRLAEMRRRVFLADVLEVAASARARASLVLLVPNGMKKFAMVLMTTFKRLSGCTSARTTKLCGLGSSPQLLPVQADETRDLKRECRPMLPRILVVRIPEPVHTIEANHRVWLLRLLPAGGTSKHRSILVGDNPVDNPAQLPARVHQRRWTVTDEARGVARDGPVTLSRTLNTVRPKGRVIGRALIASLLPATTGAYGLEEQTARTPHDQSTLAELYARLDRIESFLIPDVERKADEIGDQQIEMETELEATTRSVTALTRRLQSLEQSHKAFREEIRAWRRERAPTEEPARKCQRPDVGSCRDDDGQARRNDPPQGPPPAGIAGVGPRRMLDADAGDLVAVAYMHLPQLS
ncbi:hypothetical protein PINS_up016064 [Pythium insidiosum]|nr:hypothetical protein PINS_up016064 [Pythium insidiosum]